MMNNKSEDRFSDDDVWEDAMLEELIKTEELVLSSKAKPPSNPSLSHPPPLPAISYVPQQPLRSVAVSTCDAAGFSPPRELSQRTTLFDSLHHSPSRPPKPDSDKDLEISRLKRELGRATKQIANLEKECLKFQNEEKSGRIKCSESIHKDSEILALDYDKIPSKFPNGVSSNNLAVETTFKAIGIQTDMVNHQEAQGCICDDLPDYSDLSQKLVAVWGSPTDKKLGTNAISKLLVGCQRDFHILFGCMSMSLPSEITRELLTDISSSGVALHYLKDCFHTTEAEKVSHLYLALTKIADGTYVLETLIEPLLDLCGMENVVIVRSSLCILHTLLKLLMELEKNFGRSGLCSGTMSSLKDFAMGRTLWILADWKM